jgi:sulfonate transport system substrate-binding protein
VPKDSTVRTVADLKGKKIALNKGSNVHYFLVKLLEKHGLKLHRRDAGVPAAGRCARRLREGLVDAWVIWDPFLAAAKSSSTPACSPTRPASSATAPTTSRRSHYVEKNAAGDPRRVEEINRDQVGQGPSARLAEPPNCAACRACRRRRPGREPNRYGTAWSDHRRHPGRAAAIADTFFELKLIPKPVSVREASWKAGQ